jgi:hypothetical protein
MTNSNKILVAEVHWDSVTAKRPMSCNYFVQLV